MYVRKCVMVSPLRRVRTVVLPYSIAVSWGVDLLVCTRPVRRASFYTNLARVRVIELRCHLPEILLYEGTARGWSSEIFVCTVCEYRTGRYLSA